MKMVVIWDIVMTTLTMEAVSPLKRRSTSRRLHGLMSQNAVIFISDSRMFAKVLQELLKQYRLFLFAQKLK
jgi:hypothetical protein